METECYILPNSFGSSNNVTVSTTGEVTQHNYQVDDSIFMMRELHRTIHNIQHSAAISKHFLGSMSRAGLLSSFNNSYRTKYDLISRNQYPDLL